MAILTILQHPDPRLRQTCSPVSRVDSNIHQLIDDMFETMYGALGIGLAAIQVNVHQRLIITDVSEDQSAPLVLINPEIIASGGVTLSPEGCLSVPGFYEEVERAENVTVRALDRDGHTFEEAYTGLQAVCIQHEIDHLNGKLFVDYLSTLKRHRIEKKLKKVQKDSAKGNL